MYTNQAVERSKAGNGQVVRGVSPISKEKAYGGKDLPKSQVLSSEWKTEVVTDSGYGGESGGDELPCATEGEGGDCVWRGKRSSVGSSFQRQGAA